MTLNIDKIHDRALEVGKKTLKEVGGKINPSLMAAIAISENAIILRELEKALGRIEELEKQVTKAEQNMRYKGRWQPALQYSPGDVVSCEQSLYHCSADSEIGRKPRNANGWTQMFNTKASER